MSRLKLSIAAVLLVGAAACSTGKREEPKKEAAEPAAAVPAAATAPAVTPEAAPAVAPAAPKPVKRAPHVVRPVRTEPRTQQAEQTLPPPRTPIPPPAPPADGPGFERTPAPPPPPPQPAPVVVKAGTRLAVRLSEPLSTAHNAVGDSFKALLDRDLEVDGQVVAPAGSMVVGKVASVAQSGRVEGRARMTLALTSIHVGRQEYPIETNTMSFEAEKSTKQDAAKVGGGAALGAIIGAIAGGGKGAAIGAVVGGAAGTGTVLATRGKDVEVKAEEILTFRLENEVAMRAVRE